MVVKELLQIFELSSGELLGSVTFPKPITAICVDATEAFLFAGSNSGDVYKLSLHAHVDRLPDPSLRGSDCLVFSGHKLEKCLFFS